jgi:hypothetical protein
MSETEMISYGHEEIDHLPRHQTTTSNRSRYGSLLAGFAIGATMVALINVGENNSLSKWWYVTDDECHGPTSLIAIIQPTILNECTGCPNPMICNIPSALGGGDGCVKGWIRFDKVTR